MDIAAFAAGYNQLLQAGNMGEGLRQAADFLQPTMDLFNMLGAGRRRFIRGSGNLISGDTTQALVPLSEIWFVRHAGFVINTDATGTALGAYIGYLPAGSGVGGTSMPISPGLNVAVSSKGALTAKPDLIALPGDQFTVRGNAVTATITYEFLIVYDLIKGP